MLILQNLDRRPAPVIVEGGEGFKVFTEARQHEATLRGGGYHAHCRGRSGVDGGVGCLDAAGRRGGPGSERLSALLGDLGNTRRAAVGELHVGDRGSDRDAGEFLAVAFFNRGLVYLNRQDYDRAIADFDHAIALNPKDAPAFNGRGIAYRAKGRNDRAIEDFDQAIELRPNFALAFSNRGVAYQNKGSMIAP